MLACPWPPAEPMIRELASMGYYSQYTTASWGGVVPKGISGATLIEMGNRLYPEYRKLYGDQMAECRKRGALEGYGK